ncbi:MAG: hypothetical protein SPK03_08265 [Alloprevotella sp.]|nr:hypothetical protein [Alloprevotella sp.]
MQTECSTKGKPKGFPFVLLRCSLFYAKIVQGESLGKEKLVFIGLGRAAAYLSEAMLVQGESLGKGFIYFYWVLLFHEYSFGFHFVHKRSTSTPKG